MEKKIKDFEVKYKDKKEDKKVLDRIAEIYSIETRHAIIMAIITFGSSNIKRLSKILSKNEATIYYHIKELTKKPEFLRIDEEITHAKKGIFYQPTELALKYFSEPQPEFMENAFTQLYEVIETKSDEEVGKFYYDLMAKNPDLGETAQRDKRRLAYNHILENFMINNIETAEIAIKNGAQPINKQYPIGSIIISSIEMKIGNLKHLFEILKVIAEMYGNLSRLQDKFTKEMDKQKIPEEERINVHYHTVGGELAEFEFK